MQFWKRLAALALAVGIGVSLLAGCGQKEPAEVPAEGFSLSVCVGAVPDTLDPIYAENAGDQTILNHLYENLMRIAVDEEGNETVALGMAKSIEKERNFDGTVTYTFRLRDAKWSDGKYVKADHFVYAWQRLVNPVCNSPYADLLSIVCGYEEARVRRDMTLLQVKAKNNETLVVTLKGDYDWFLTQICTATATMPLREDVVQKLKDLGIQREEEFGRKRLWWEETAQLVTNGVYHSEEYHEGAPLRLHRNKYYVREEGAKGAHELLFHFASSAEAAQILYQGNVVDVAWPLTETRLTELSAQENWEGGTELETYAVLLNTESPLLQDDRIRHAVSLVVDRNEIAPLAGAMAVPAEGLVPAGVPDREGGDFRAKGEAILDNDPANYKASCAEAKNILANAGYAGSGTLQGLEYLYEDDGSNAAVAEILCRQWQKQLGITVTPRGVTKTELWAALRSGNYSLAGAELGSEVNDAEGFLTDWTSKSPDNVINYQSSAYDTLMTIVATAKDVSARMGCLYDAETLLLNNHAIVPLYTAKTGWEGRETLKGVCRDPRGWFSFTDAEWVTEN